MIRGVEDYEDQRTINLIVQARVVNKLCLDCGKRLIHTSGYCDNRKCGHVSTRVTHTKAEWEAAEEIRNKRRRKK